MSSETQNISPKIEKQRKPWYKRLAYWGGVILLSIVFLLGLCWLVLQTEWGKNQVRLYAEDIINQQLNATVSIGKLGGSVLSELALYNVKLVQEGKLVLEVDTLLAGYDIWGFVSGEIRVNKLHLLGNQLFANQQPDSSWNFMHLLKPSAEEADTTAMPWKFQLENVVVHRTQGQMHFLGEPPNTAILHQFEVSLKDVFMETLTAGTLENLAVVVQLPTRSDSLKLAAKGTWKDMEATIENLTLSSAFSHVKGQGKMVYPEPNQLNDSDFSLTIHPLDFRDIAPFAPFLSAEEKLDLALTLKAEKQVFKVDLKGDFKRGASLELTSNITLATDKPVHYTIEGNTQKLNLAYLTAMPDLASNLNAAIEGTFDGVSLQTLSGQGKLHILSKTSFQDKTIYPSEVKFTAHNGFGDLELNTQVNQSKIKLNGGGRWFDEIPVYRLQGSFQHLNITDFLPNYRESWTNLTGTLEIEGNGFSLENGSQTVNLTLARGSIFDYPLVAANLLATQQNNKILFDVAGQMPQQGQVTSKGLYNLNDFSFDVSEGTISNINLRALMGPNADRSNLNATYEISGKGTSLEDLAFDGTVHVLPTQYDVYEIEQGVVKAQFSNQKLTYNVETDLAEGHIMATGFVLPFATPLTFEVETGDFQNLNPQYFVADKVEGRLTGNFTLQGTGSTWDDLEINTLFHLRDSAYNEYEIQDGVLRATLSGGILSYNVTARTNLGAVDFAGNTNLVESVPKTNLTAGKFQHLNLAKLFNNPELQSDLSGVIEVFSVDGESLENFSADIQLELSESTFYKQSLRSGKIYLKVTPEEALLNVSLAPEEGHVEVVGNATFENQIPTYTLQGQASDLDLSKWIYGADTLQTALQTTFHVEGTGTVLETMEATGWLKMAHSTLNDVVIDTLNTDFSLSEGTLNLAQFNLKSNVLELTGSGPFVIEDTFNGETTDVVFQGNLKNLTPIKSFVGAHTLSGEGKFRGTIRGMPDNINFRFATINEGLELLSYDEVRIGRLRGNVTASLKNKQWSFQTGLNLNNLSVPGYLFTESDLNATWLEEQLSFESSFQMANQLKGKIVGNYTSTETDNLDITALNLDFGDEQWHLQNPTQLMLSENKWQIQDLKLAAENQLIALTGSLDFEGNQQVDLSFQQVSLNNFATLLGYPQFSGVLNGTFNLQGSAVNPILEGHFIAEEVTLTENDTGKFFGELLYQDKQIVIDGSLVGSDEKALRIQGFIPANLALVEQKQKALTGATNLNIFAQDFEVSWLNPFVDASFMDEINGSLTCNIAITGAFENPNIQGTMQLTDIRFNIPFLGVQYTEGKANVVLEGKQARVTNLYAKTPESKGEITGTGTISLSTLNFGELDFDLASDHFKLIRDGTFYGVATGTATLKGTTERPILDGDVIMDELEIVLNTELMESAREAIELTERDIQEVEAKFGVRVTATNDTSNVTFYQATDINLRAKSYGKAWIRSHFDPLMNIEMEGTLDIRKPALGTEVVFGELNAREGRNSYVDFKTRRFQIQTGEINFNGDMFNPTMNILAQYVGPGQARNESQTINLNISGEVEDSQFSFSADPAMEESEIVEYLIFGQPVQSLNQEFVGNFVGNLASGYGLSLVESLLGQRQRIRFDLVEIKQDEENRPVLKLGRYISRKFFVVADTQLDKGSLKDFIFEYQAKRWMLFQLRAGEDLTGVYVLLEYAF